MNLGEVSDEDAKAKTIWAEVANVPFDDDLLGNLLVELKGQIELPYSDAEIELITGVFPEIAEEEMPETIDDNTTKYSISVYKEDRAEVKKAHSTIISALSFEPELINKAIIETADLEKIKEYLTKE